MVQKKVYINNGIISDAYVSLNVVPITPLKSLQEKLCDEFALIQREELHITIGFLGEVKKNSLKKLADLLMNQIHENLRIIHAEGIGGVAEFEGGLQLIDKNNKDNAKNYPRVFWISVKCIDSLCQLRLKLADAAKAAKIKANILLTPIFYPHVTIGSNGPGDKDYSLWDIHTIAKKPSLEAEILVQNIYCDRFHITCTDIHPKSIQVIRSWQSLLQGTFTVS